MHIAVIGAGVIGVTTAWELIRDGHDVTVLERRGSVAAEGSFANAGVIAPGYVTPWAAPGMPRKVLGHLLRRHAPVRVHGDIDGATMRWMWLWWRACATRLYRANRTRMQRLASYSRERLRGVVLELGLDYERSDGVLMLLRSQRDVLLAQPSLQVLKDCGIEYSLLDAAACRIIEPGLSADTPLAAGIALPTAEVGNCRQFALLLRRHAQRRGVQFRFQTEVSQLRAGAPPSLVYQRTSERASMQHAPDETASDDAPATQPHPEGPTDETFDAIVVCAALGSRALLRPLGVRLPIAPVYGYSITAPLREIEAHPHIGPRSALIDERYKIAVSRMGRRVRVAGSAELGGRPNALDPAAFATLYKVLDDWFPGSTRVEQAQQWKGARPMLPDGPPVLGACRASGVWLNLGHGSSGWALACGSARVVADAIAGRAPAIDVEGLGIERLG